MRRPKRYNRRTVALFHIAWWGLVGILTLIALFIPVGASTTVVLALGAAGMTFEGLLYTLAAP
ncbi:hypothetical protein EON79_18760 [bacterium]|nr:MAG: hypothetical protein EON79_18760 [bacterium]